MRILITRLAIAALVFYIIMYSAYKNLVEKFFYLDVYGMIAVCCVPLIVAGFIYIGRTQKKLSLKSSEKFIITALLYVSVYAMFAYDVYQQSTGSLPIMVAALFATLGWLYTANENRNNNRKAHTLNILLQMRNSAEYNKHREVAIKYLGHEISIDTNKIKSAQLKVKSEDIDVRRSVVYLANYFEFISVGYVTRDLDESLLIKSFSSILTNFWDSFHPFLMEERADDYGRYNPSIYENLELTAKELKRKKAKQGIVLGAPQPNRTHKTS